MRTLRRYLKPVVLLLVQALFSLADVLMAFVADKSGDSAEVEAAAITEADVAEALAAVHIAASCELAGFSEGTAAAFITAKIDPASVDRMLVTALRQVQ